MAFNRSNPPIKVDNVVKSDQHIHASTVAQCFGAQLLIFANAIGDGVVDHIARGFGWEQETFEAASTVLNTVKGGSVLDIGANCGAFCIPLANRHRSSSLQFHAFEPQKMLFQQICGSAALNGLHNVTVHNYGCGEKYETVNVPLPDYLKNSSGYSLRDDVMQFLGEYEPHNYLYSDVMGSFQIRPIDDLNLSDVVLMKIDVEGMETAVLKGAEKTIERSGYPVILYESWKHGWRRAISAEADDYVLSLGYKTTQIDLETVVCFHPDSHILAFG